MSVTAYLVTRNHESSVARAVQSVAGLASEVLVIDTGSTDQTVAVAERGGATVHRFAWADDFAAACNYALDRATGEWTFLLNPDEEFEPEGRPPLTAQLGIAQAFAVQVRVRQQLRPDQPAYGTADWQTRLVRKDPAVRYRGRLHPEFAPPLAEIAARRGQVIARADATIRRHAYLSQPTPDKLRWVVRLLEAELRDRPGQLHFLIELGRNLLWLNDPRGHEVLAEAAEQLHPAADAPAAPHPVVGSLLEYLLTVSPDQARSPIARDLARELAVRWFSYTPPVVWALAGERFAAGDHAGAVPHLERLLEMGRTGQFDTGGGFDPDILGPTALLNLGVCHIHLGNWEAARACLAPVMTDPAHGVKAARLYGYAVQKQKPDANAAPG